MLIETVDPDDSVLVVLRHAYCEIFRSFNVITLHNNIKLNPFLILSYSKQSPFNLFLASIRVSLHLVAMRILA